MEIATTFSHLQAELNQARESLKGVDENIKRFLGRDPNDPTPAVKLGIKRTVDNQLGDDPRGRNRNIPPSMRRRSGGHDKEGSPPTKRRPSQGNVFSRLSGLVRTRRDLDSGGEDDDHREKPAIQSQVIATSGLVVSKKEVVAAQNPDEKSKARNRRMFGALLGTLQKFRQEETKLKDKEDKRAKVEMKLEEAARQEKEKVLEEKAALFTERKLKQANLKKIEYKMHRMNELVEWEAKQRLLVNFIKTKTSPAIFYLPKTHNETTLKLLAETKDIIEKSIEAKKEEFEEELEQVERRGRMRQERERAAAEGEFVGRQRPRDIRGQDRRGKRWGEEEDKMKRSRKPIKRVEPSKENQPEDDSDLEADAGPELDVDNVGKDDEHGDEVKGGETIEVTFSQVVDEEKTDQHSSNTSMNVDEKEFEPVYD